jgi:zinc/manganese transport system substrate-binding protein
VNPHVWLDPRLAARQVKTIRDGLRAADPACGPSYDANTAAFLAQLAELDAELERRLRPHAGRTFVAFHDIAPYFARRYGLKARFLVAVPEERPSAADLRRVGQLVRRQGLRALLGEPGRPDPVFAALAADLGVPILDFDPLEAAPGGDQAALPPQHYLGTMRRNLTALLQALGARTAPAPADAQPAT